MIKAPKSLRLQIGLFGRTNVGKSSFLNLVAGQDVAITSPIAGTTTDVVEKPMELLPVGPVVFLDTAGLDDLSELSRLRMNKTQKIFDRADVVTLITEPGVWSEYEDKLIMEAGGKNIPVIIVINKTDTKVPSAAFIKDVKKKTERIILCSSINKAQRDNTVNLLKRHLLEVCPDDFLKPPSLIGDLMPPEAGLAVLIVPIDLEAPRGRLILPQVQTIRDILDCDSSCVVVKENQYASLLKKLNNYPDIVVCDSQVVLKMVSETPDRVNCTTFSILFSRFKGDLVEMARSAAVIGTLKPGDRVLIAEACSHHAIEDDIGRIKIPAWLEKYVGGKLDIAVCAGRDYPDNIGEYKLVIHCGGCMITRRETLFRIQKAKEAGVPITNYGLAIAFSQGVIRRVLSVFPSALKAFDMEISRLKEKDVIHK